MTITTLSVQEAFAQVKDPRVQEALAFLNLHSSTGFEENQLFIRTEWSHCTFRLLEPEIDTSEFVGDFFMSLRELDALMVVLGSVGFHFSEKLKAKLERRALQLSVDDLEDRSKIVNARVGEMVSDMGGVALAAYLRQLADHVEKTEATPFAHDDERRRLALAATSLKVFAGQ